MPNFTDRTLKGLRVDPGKKDRLVFDSDCPGLGVRVTARGTRSFICQWTDPATRQKRREPIGVWGSITIEQARAAARARLGQVAKGIDPAAERRTRKEKAEAERAEAKLSLDGLISDWAKKHLTQKRPRYAAEAVRALRYAFADYLKQPAARLSRATAIAVLDEMAGSGKGTTAGRTMAYGRSMYSWATKRELVSANPFHNLPISSATTERDRALTDEELAEIYAAAQKLPYPFGPFYLIALFTLQRREEVAGMRWSELSPDLGLWTIPAERMKNRKPHDVHLSDAARAVLRSIPRLAHQDYVFTTTGRGPVSGFSRARSLLDARITANRDGAPLASWRLHDFRRSGVTRLAGMGFDSIVVDKLLAHKPARLKGVAAIYQRHEFMEERKRALEAWAALLTRSPGATILPFKAGL